MSRLYNHKAPNKPEFGIRLENMLRKRNISQTDLSKMIGYSKPAIHHWLYGNCEMRISVFAKIVDALQLSATDIGYLLEPYWEENNE